MGDLATWRFLVAGYLGSVLVETPVLVWGLSRKHALKDRLLAGFWLTGCTYPVIVLLIPQWVDVHAQRMAYVAASESFAALAECAIFWWTFDRGTGGTRAWAQDMGTIWMANLLSWAVGALGVSAALSRWATGG